MPAATPPSKLAWYYLQSFKQILNELRLLHINHALEESEEWYFTSLSISWTAYPCLGAHPYLLESSQAQSSHISDSGPQLIPQSCPGPRVWIWTVFNWPRLSETPPLISIHWEMRMWCSLQTWMQTVHRLGLWSVMLLRVELLCWVGLSSKVQVLGQNDKGFLSVLIIQCQEETSGGFAPIQWAWAGIQSHFSLGSHGSKYLRSIKRDNFCYLMKAE